MGTSSTRAKQKYNKEAYDRIETTVHKGRKKVIQDFAKEKRGFDSLNAYINHLIEEDMKKGGEQ